METLFTFKVGNETLNIIKHPHKIGMACHFAIDGEWFFASLISIGDMVIGECYEVMIFTSNKSMTMIDEDVYEDRFDSLPSPQEFASVVEDFIKDYNELY